MKLNLYMYMCVCVYIYTTKTMKNFTISNCSNHLQLLSKTYTSRIQQTDLPQSTKNCNKEVVHASDLHSHHLDNAIIFFILFTDTKYRYQQEHQLFQSKIDYLPCQAMKHQTVSRINGLILSVGRLYRRLQLILSCLQFINLPKSYQGSRVTKCIKSNTHP